MRKIGISIKPTISGNYQPVSANEGEWTRRIRDMRHALLHYPVLKKDHKQVKTLFFFDQTGCYIVMSRTVSNKDLENVSGWIHIPFDIKISTAELDEVINNVRQLVARPELPHKHYLQQLFGSKFYQFNPGARMFGQSPHNSIFAKRRLKQNQSLASLLGENMFQPTYSNYEAILIEDSPGEVVDAVDLTEPSQPTRSQAPNPKNHTSNPVKRVTYPHTNSKPTHPNSNHTQPNSRPHNPAPKPTHHPTTKPVYNPEQNHQNTTYSYREVKQPNFTTPQYDDNSFPPPPSQTPPEQYAVSGPEDSMNLFQRHGIGFIAGTIFGIIVGILCILPFAKFGGEKDVDITISDSLQAVENITDSVGGSESNAASAVQTDATSVAADSVTTSGGGSSASPSRPHRNKENAAKEQLNYTPVTPKFRNEPGRSAGKSQEAARGDISSEPRPDVVKKPNADFKPSSKSEGAGSNSGAASEKPSRGKIIQE